MKNKKEKIAAVVVTYNRKELLKGCLDALLNQTYPLDSIILIDNASTDGTPEFLREKGYFDNPKIDYVRLPENIGGAGGFYEGMKRGYKKGYDWLWLMDDDAIPLDDALEKLLKASKSLSTKKKKGVFVSSLIASRKEIRNSMFPKIIEINKAMFVGWLNPYEIINSIGFPRKDFFIYWDDIEYSQRLKSHGFRIYKVTDSYIIHKDWTAQTRKNINVLFRKVSRPIYQDWKSYYLFRNKILMHKLNHHNFQLLKTFFWEIPKEIFIRFLMKDMGKIKFILKAVVDGLMNREGKRIAPEN
jgi:GT2 family glycosyltransferase